MDTKTQTLKAFVDDVMSSSPAPGGGSVSALAAAQGAALAAMVIALSEGKKFFIAYESDIQAKLIELKAYFAAQKDRFLQAADDDTAAYNSFVAALKMAKSSDEEKKARHAAMESAQRASLAVPLAMAKDALETLENLEWVARYGNANAISDVAVGAMALEMAVQGGVLNARINLPGLDDETIASTLSTSHLLAEKAVACRQAVLQIVESRIAKP